MCGRNVESKHCRSSALDEGVDNIELLLGSAHKDDPRQVRPAQHLHVLFELRQFGTVPQLAPILVEKVHLNEVAKDVDRHLVVVGAKEMVPHAVGLGHGLVRQRLASRAFAEQEARFAAQRAGGVLEQPSNRAPDTHTMTTIEMEHAVGRLVLHAHGALHLLFNSIQFQGWNWIVVLSSSDEIS